MAEKINCSISDLRNILQSAVDRFNHSVDRESLLCSRGKDAQRHRPEWAAASERSIAHRLAFYLECELRCRSMITDERPLCVDCEFNRHEGAKKAMNVVAELAKIVKKARRKPIPSSDEDGWYVFSVAPDIVVHERGTDESNLLVIELKKETNNESPDYDALKLNLFTYHGEDGYGYRLGASVVARDDRDLSERNLVVNKYYQDGREID